MAELNLYSTKEGKQVPFKVEVDTNGELVASHGEEFVKFPAGLNKTELNKLVALHNKANDGVVERSKEEVDAEEKAKVQSQKLVDSL